MILSGEVFRSTLGLYGMIYLYTSSRVYIYESSTRILEIKCHSVGTSVLIYIGIREKGTARTKEEERTAK